MSIATIISEYNPLHLGHEYHIHRTREITGCDSLIVVMSGNFVQRGEGSILTKYTRASSAIKAGADMVIELPPISALSSARYFALGGVAIASSIPNSKWLSFGSESGDIKSLTSLVELSESVQYNQYIREFLDKGMSYPVACQKSLEAVSNRLITPSPNNTLGMEYIRAIKSLNSHILPITIPRLGNGYHDTALATVGGFSSASAIREAICSGANVSSMIPKYCQKLMENTLKIDTNILFALCVRAIMDMSQKEKNKVYEGGEGLINRLYNASLTARNYDELVELTHTKRYTKSKINRLILHLILGHTSDLLDDKLCYNVLAVEANHKHLLSLAPQSDKDCDSMGSIATADYIYGLATANRTEPNSVRIVAR